MCVLKGKLCIERSLTITNRTDYIDYIALPQKSTFLQYIKCLDVWFNSSELVLITLSLNVVFQLPLPLHSRHNTAAVRMVASLLHQFTSLTPACIVIFTFSEDFWCRLNTDTVWYQHRLIVGRQTLVEAGTNRHNFYIEINKTIILGPDKISRIINSQS